MTATSPQLNVPPRPLHQAIRDHAKRMAAQNHLPLLHHLQLDEPARLRDLAASVEIIHARLWDTEDRTPLNESIALDCIANAMTHLDEAMNALRTAADAME